MGLPEIIARASEAQRLPRCFERLVGGQHHDLDRGVDRLEFAQHFHAGHPLHQDVEHRHVDGLVLGQRERLDAARGNEHIVIVLEDDAQRLPWPFLVIAGDEEGFRLYRGGRRVRTGDQVKFETALLWKWYSPLAKVPLSI